MGTKRISPLVWKPFLRLLPIQIFEIIVFAVNTFVDSVITSRFLGTEAMAAIGLFSPVATVIGITEVVVFGTQILCGRYIGAGEGNKVVSLFSTGFIFLGAFSLALSTVCLLFRHSLSELLGAGGELAVLLADYMAGYAPGIAGRVLMGMLMVFLPYNNDLKRCYLSIGVMIASNVALDILFVSVLNTGIIGMGLATSVSYLLSFAVMLPGIMSEKRAVFLRFRSLCFSRLPEAAFFGLPSLMFVVGCTIKAYVMNLTLISHVGAPAVAAMTVQGNVCAIIGAIPLGCANTFLALGSIYFGEEDRHSLVALLRFALGAGAVLSAMAAALLMACSVPLSTLFFSPAEEAWAVTSRMLLVFPGYLVLNTVLNLFLKTYQLQKRTLLVNVLSVAETLIMAFFSVALVGVLGADAVWWSFHFGDFICLLVVAVSVMALAGKITFSLPDWMKLSPDFGASAEECLEFSVSSMDQVLQVSATVIGFCRKRDIDERRSFIAGLSVEEMVGNVVEHGFRPGEKHHVSVRLVAKNGLTIRVRDDCRAFDPKMRLNQFEPQDAAENIGIRMIAGMAGEMNYQCTGGINTLLLRI